MQKFFSKRDGVNLNNTATINISNLKTCTPNALSGTQATP